MADWLRNLGQRSSTPNDSPDERNSSGHDRDLGSPSRVHHSARRVASLLSLSSKDHQHGGDHHAQGTFGSPSSSGGSSGHASRAKGSSSKGSGSAKEAALNERWHTDLDQLQHGPDSSQPSDLYGDGFNTAEAERIWSNPSIHQMVSTLQVAMMNRSDVRTPLPVRFNSHVLAVIEGYRNQRKELAKAAQDIADVQELRERDADSFGRMSSEWMARERDFLAEIKRLELQLADTQNGMEAVMLARSGSLVDRGAMGRKKFEERMKERVQRMSTGGSKIEEEDTDDTPTAPVTTGLTRTATCHKTIGSIPRVLDPDHDRRLSEVLKPSTHKPRHKHVKHRRPSMEPQQLEQIKKPEEIVEERVTYMPMGSSPTSRGRQRPANEEHRPHFDVDGDSSSSSVFLCDSSSSSSSEATNIKGKGVVRESKITDYFSRPLAQTQHQVLPDASRRFSFAVGEEDKLPMTPMPVVSAVPESDGACDEYMHAANAVPTHTEEWLARQEGVVFDNSPDIKLSIAGMPPRQTDFELGRTEQPGPQKSDSSSSRNTAIRTNYQDRSSSPMTASRDTLTSDKAETENFKAELQSARLDAMSANDMRRFERAKAEQKDPFARDVPSRASGRGSRHTSYKSQATEATETGAKGLLRGGLMASKTGTFNDMGKSGEGAGQGDLQVPRATEGVRRVNRSPSPSAKRGTPITAGPSSTGRGHGRSPFTGPEDRTFTPNRSGNPAAGTRRPSNQTVPSRTTSGGATRGDPTSPVSPTLLHPGPSNDSRTAAQIAAQMAVARGIRRAPGSGDSNGPRS